MNPTSILEPVLQRPDFPACRVKGHALSLEEGLVLPECFPPLRTRSGSGKAVAIRTLLCRTDAGAIAGGCAVGFPGTEDAPSPRQLPHSVLGEWISALRFSGRPWLECGSPAGSSRGFAEDAILRLLWDGLLRLMRRNGIPVLLGAAAADSRAFAEAMHRGARPLDRDPGRPERFFLYAD